MNLNPISTEPAGSGKGDDTCLRLATEIVSSYVMKNLINSADLPKLIRVVHRTLLELAQVEGAKSLSQTPAVPTEKSVTREFIICLEDGKKLKMLKRHLRSKFGLTPDQYRAKWNLPHSYPMVAPGYADQRSKLAKEIGLGRKPTYLTRKKFLK
ncbi:MAG: MucR family transcriptional regulator [Proteobacteria bacterium]|nr:MucR family transcriptional regulator [Pseudomonadota bacterium]